MPTTISCYQSITIVYLLLSLYYCSVSLYIYILDECLTFAAACLYGYLLTASFEVAVSFVRAGGVFLGP